MLKAKFTLSDSFPLRKGSCPSIDFSVRKLYNVATKEAYCPFHVYEKNKIFDNTIT